MRIKIKMNTSRRGFLRGLAAGVLGAGGSAATATMARTTGARGTLPDMISIDVRAHGAVGDGIADDTAAIQSAMNAAMTTPAAPTAPRRVVYPAGTFLLSSTVTGVGAIELCGAGPERTVLIPPAAATAVRLGSTVTTQPHGLVVRDLTFRSALVSGVGHSTAYPMLDVQQYGRKWSIERVHFDAQFGNRPGVRLWSSWVGSLRDCNFWKFGTEGVASDRAAVIIKPQALANGNGPINNVLLDACAFERVQTGIDLHDPTEGGQSTTIYSIEIRNPRFKNTSVSGYVANSVGIRSGSNNTFNVMVTSPFFEDFQTGIKARGWGWIIDAPFGQSADRVIDLVSGGGHSIRGLVLQGALNNEITTGVHCGSGISGTCTLDLWKSVGAAGYLTNPWVDDTTGKLVVTAA